MTVLELIQRGTDFLASKGVESPRLHAELLLAHQLRLPRMRLYLEFERVLTERDIGPVREMVKRRALREPVQQITGSTSFCGLEIFVNRYVLVPRPETEILAEMVWTYLNRGVHSLASPAAAAHVASAGVRLPAPEVLDFGTGSGCIAIAVSAHCPKARIVALEISPDALEVARRNAAHHNLEGRLEFVTGDGFAALPPAARFDLIVSNPPYIPSGDIGALQPEVRDYEPRGALDGGPDGLYYHRLIATEAAAWMKPGGRVMVEIGDGQAEAVRAIFEQEKWIVEAITADYNQRHRIISARRDAFRPKE